MTKACSVCKVEKAGEEYSPDRRARDGLQSCCRVCSRDRWRARYQADPGAGAARQRAYYAENTARVTEINNRSRAKNRVKVLADKKADYERKKTDPEWQRKQREARSANKASKAEYDRQYRADRADELTARRKKWAEDNPARQSFIKRTYKARRRAKVKGGDPAPVLRQWEEAAPKVCYWCGTKCKALYHVDHYVPLARGGRHEVANLVIACPPCNIRKNARDPHEFAVQVGRVF